MWVSKVSLFGLKSWDDLPCKSNRRQHVFLCDSLGCASLIGDGSGKNVCGHMNTRRKQKNITGELSKQGTHFISHFRVGIPSLWTIISCPKFKPLGRPSLWNHKCRLKAVLDHQRWKTCEQLRVRLKICTRNPSQSSAVEKYSFSLTPRGMEGGGKNKRNANRQKITGYMSALLQIEKLWGMSGQYSQHRTLQKSSIELSGSYCGLVASYAPFILSLM